MKKFFKFLTSLTLLVGLVGGAYAFYKKYLEMPKNYDELDDDFDDDLDFDFTDDDFDDDEATINEE